MGTEDDIIKEITAAHEVLKTELKESDRVAQRLREIRIKNQRLKDEGARTSKRMDVNRGKIILVKKGIDVHQKDVNVKQKKREVILPNVETLRQKCDIPTAEEHSEMIRGSRKKAKTDTIDLRDKLQESSSRILKKLSMHYYSELVGGIRNPQGMETLSRLYANLESIAPKQFDRSKRSPPKMGFPKPQDDDTKEEQEGPPRGNGDKQSAREKKKSSRSDGTKTDKRRKRDISRSTSRSRSTSIRSCSYSSTRSSDSYSRSRSYSSRSRSSSYTHSSSRSLVCF